MVFSAVWLLLSFLLRTAAADTLEEEEVDVLIYGGTPAGIAASIAASSIRNTRVLLIEPTSHVGGMATEGGIGFRDGPDYIRSGSQRQWGMLNAEHYNSTQPIWQPDNWVGEASFMKMLKHAKVEVRFNTFLVEGPTGLRIDPGPPFRKITKAALQTNASTTWVSVGYVIDASYEGEVVMSSNVTFTYGRESRWQYNESRAGVTKGSEAQFPVPVDPFLSDGELLRFVSMGRPDPRHNIGEADENVMAFSYRVCLTRDVHNFVPVAPPDKYDARDFELARRLVLGELRANQTLSEPWGNLVYSKYSLTNKTQKYDACCGSSPVGIDATGLAVGYATASRQERAKIAALHRYYVQGLMWFWRSDPSVPLKVRKQHAQLGLCKDEWADNGHFPRQLYVREAIRLVGDKVFTQHDRSSFCRDDSIAVGTWGFDVHDMQRVAVQNEHNKDWTVMNEGLTTFENGGVFPFDLPYSIVLPKRAEMGNLAAPNCPSTSHVAFAAIREEPTLWQLGQAAGTAAAIAAQKNVSLHHVDVTRVQRSLLQQDSYIHWPPARDCSETNYQDFQAEITISQK